MNLTQILNDPNTSAEEKQLAIGEMLAANEQNVGNLVKQQGQNRRDTLQNIRSPFVRRDISGNVVDESQTKSGLDYLKAGDNTGGYSWEQPKTPFVPYSPQEQSLIQSANQNPIEKRSANGVTSVQGKYGGGFSTNGPRNTNPGRGGINDPVLPSERPKLQADIQNAQNSTYSPFAEVASQAPVPATPVPMNNPVVSSPMPQAQTPAPSGQGLYNPETPAMPSYSPFMDPTALDAGPPMMPGMSSPQVSAGNSYQSPRAIAQSPLYQPPTDDVGKANDINLYANEAIKHDDPGFIPWLGRYIGTEATGAYDEVANALFRKGSERGRPTQTAFANWIYGRPATN